MCCVYFLSFVGNSDLGKDNKPVFDKKRDLNIYEESKKLYESKKFDDLEPILIKDMIKELKEIYDNLKIILFATKQNPVHKQDTVYIGKIINEILEKQGFNVKLVEINFSPVDYEKMFEFIDNYIQKELKDQKEIYINITGGTPAEISIGFLLSIAYFGNNVHILYKPKNKEDFVEFEDITNKVYRIYLEREFKSLCEKRYYGLAAEKLKKYKKEENDFYYYLKGVDEYYKFNLKRSKEYLLKALDTASLKRKGMIKNKIRIIDNIENGDLFEKIKVLMDIFLIKYEQEEYTYCLGLLFRIRESILRYLVEKYLGVSTEKNEKKEFHEFENFIKNNPDLKRYLDKNNARNYEPNQYILNLVLYYYIEEKKELNLKKDGRLWKLVKDMKNLDEKRNKSILAHGFKIGEKEDIEPFTNVFKEIIGDPFESKRFSNFNWE